MSVSELVQIGVLFVLVAVLVMAYPLLLRWGKMLHDGVPQSALSFFVPLLEEAFKRGAASVKASPNTVDDELWRVLEPKLRDYFGGITGGGIPTEEVQPAVDGAVKADAANV